MFNEIFKKAQETLFMPFVRRIASNGATALAALGLETQSIETVEAALVILGGFAIDLMLSRSNLKYVKTSVFR